MPLGALLFAVAFVGMSVWIGVPLYQQIVVSRRWFAQASVDPVGFLAERQVSVADPEDLHFARCGGVVAGTGRGLFFTGPHIVVGVSGETLFVDAPVSGRYAHPAIVITKQQIARGAQAPPTRPTPKLVDWEAGDGSARFRLAIRRPDLLAQLEAHGWIPSPPPVR